MKLEIDTQYWLKTKSENPDEGKPELTDEQADEMLQKLNGGEVDRICGIILGFIGLAANQAHGVDTDQVAVVEDDELSGVNACVTTMNKVPEHLRDWVCNNMAYMADWYKDEEVEGCGPAFTIFVEYDTSTGTNETVRLSMFCHTFQESVDDNSIRSCSKLSFGEVREKGCIL